MLLKDVIIKFNKSTIKAGDGNTEGKYPLYTCSPIVNKYLNEYSFDDEAIILGTGGNPVINYCKGKFSVSTDCFTIKAIDKFLTKYLYYYLIGNINKIETMFRGAGLKHLNKNELLEMKINNIDKEKQIKIVNQLDIIKDIIDKKEQQLISLDELIKSLFVEIFGDFNNSKYPKEKLEKIAKVGSSHRVFTTEFVEKGIPFYRGTEITLLSNGEQPKDCYYISEEHYKRISNDDTKPKKGDLLMPSICDKGQIWLVDTEEPFYYKDGRVLSISIKVENINPKYLHYYMKNKTLEEYPKLGTGSTFAEFKIFLLKNMDVIIPPIELQNKFERCVELIDKQKFEVQKSLKEIEELKESLMNKYFG